MWKDGSAAEVEASEEQIRLQQLQYQLREYQQTVLEDQHRPSALR